MKLKKWLSRALVLAMVVALMIPVPVAAKSSGGGKLVKSVTYYDAKPSGGWQVDRKVSYNYGKKNMPTSVETLSYNKFFLGVPVGGTKDTETFKYKGKTAKAYDSAGFYTGKTVFKDGKTVSYSAESKLSETRQKEDDTYYEYAEIAAEVGHASYFKNGLAKASDYAYSLQTSDNRTVSSTSNSVYAWTQNKGIPSAVVTTYVSNVILNGKAVEGNGTPTSRYALFNSKGLTVESGHVDKDGKNVPDWVIQYTMKKGKVASAVIYWIDTKGVPHPDTMMKFSYTKKSASKTKYFNMMNSLVGHTAGYFTFEPAQFYFSLDD